MGVAAQLVITLHILFFVFVVGGFIAILAGAVKGWSWIRNPWFRLAHIGAAFVVPAEDLFTLNCPLNTLETNLRSAEGAVPEPIGGTGAVLDYLLHHTISQKSLDILYWTLGPLLIILLVRIRPQFRRAEKA